MGSKRKKRVTTPYSTKRTKMPYIMKEEAAIYIDVDDTLVVYGKNYKTYIKGTIKVKDPLDNKLMYLTPHDAHIRLAKRYKKRKFGIVVWSGNGSSWAWEVLKKLKLHNMVNAVLPKPIRYIDDMPITEWAGGRIYIPFGEGAKCESTDEK